MGYKGKKLVQRDSISGIQFTNDIPDGEYGAVELANRSASMQEQLNKAVQNDWPDSMLSTTSDADAAVYGNAGERLPRPTDYSSKGQDRFGVSTTPGKQSAKVGPRSDSKVSR